VGTQVAEQWNGTSWALTTLVKPGGSTGGVPVLGGVSCLSATSCTAVGSYYQHGIQTVSAEVWNGTAWKVQATPLGDSNTSGFAGVSCPAALDCAAVGWYQNAVSNAETTLVDVYSLSWQDLGVPQLNGVAASWYDSISCATASWCAAAGTFLTPSASVQAMVQICCGVGEDFLSTVPLSFSEFNGISCAVAGTCMAVGETSSGDGALPLAEEVQFATASQPATPLPPGATNADFNGVSCSTESDCVAVGWYTKTMNGTEFPFAEVWNGTSWSVSDPPTPSGSGGNLNGVSCNATSCTAVGSYQNASHATEALADTLTGSTWTDQTPPVPAGGSDGGLSGVSCPKSSACVGVGSYYTGSTFVADADKWNGTTWKSQVPPAPAGSSQDWLGSVSCLSAASCTAVGNTYDAALDSSVLAESYNGTTWTIQASPATGTTSSELVGLDCTSTIFCLAVGNNSGSVAVEPLAEQYS
jgi:hypothetical protein